MNKPRASGADAVNLIGFEPAYGVPPNGAAEGVYYRVPMRQLGLSAERQPEDDPTWNLGSPDAADPVEGPVVVNDSLTTPICARNIGVILRAALGDADSSEIDDTDVFEHVFTSGQALPSFSSQTGHPELAVPRWNTIYGVKAGGLSFDMARTGRALCEVPLIGQGETDDTKLPGAASFLPGVGNAGNGVLTLANPAFAADAPVGAYTVTCSTATENGGTFTVVGPGNVALGTVLVGVAFDGPVKFTIADGENDFEVGDAFTITLAPINARDTDPIQLAYLPFDNAGGSISAGGEGLANVTAARFSLNNSLEAVETIRADGLIGGIDENQRLVSGTVDIRFGGVNPLEALAASKTPATLVLRFGLRSHPAYGFELQMGRVFFFNPKTPISGPGGISQSWQWRAARDADLGYMLAAVLTNDVEAY